jgi:hypothetical protein
VLVPSHTNQGHVYSCKGYRFLPVFTISLLDFAAVQVFSRCGIVCFLFYSVFSELMTYDTTKHALIRNTPLIDNYVTHTLARYIYFFQFKL